MGNPLSTPQHLYQIYAYLKNWKSETDGDQCEGILLYPAVNYPLDLSFNLQGHSVRLCTINLDQAWQSIKAELLDLLA